MPYINKAIRGSIDDGRKPTVPGELNYSLTQLINSYVAMKGMSYTTVNDILGALEGAKLEFYRRKAAPYEDIKMSENGDVYAI